MLKFVKENQRSKEWRTMKILIDFENGMQLGLKPENLHLIDNGGTAALITKANNGIIPLLSFTSSLATPDELKAREERATAAAAAVPAPSATQPDGNWREPATNDTPGSNLPARDPRVSNS